MDYRESIERILKALAAQPHGIAALQEKYNAVSAYLDVADPEDECALYPMEPSFQLPDVFLHAGLSDECTGYIAKHAKEMSPAEVGRWNAVVGSDLRYMESVGIEGVEKDVEIRRPATDLAELEALLRETVAARGARAPGPQAG